MSDTIHPQSPVTETPEQPTATREVRYECSRHFVPILENLKASLVISTYQAGKVALLGSSDGHLTMSFHNFERPMGVAIHWDNMAVATRSEIWILKNNRAIAPTLAPEGEYGACYLARSAHVTGPIQAHEMAWAGDTLWFVNTAFSCLCTLHNDFSFVPQWRPSFITELAAEDRCHLNGLAMEAGHPRYVTVMAQSNEPQGWRPNKTETGCILDVKTNQSVASGLAMPHSPKIYENKLWVLDSGRGQLLQVNPKKKTKETVATVPGYTRGLAFCGPFAFVGLSLIRETSTFGGVPIAEDREALKCGIAVVDLRIGETVATFEFKSGVEEIFDVRIIPESPNTAMRGPFSTREDEPAIWTVPAANGD